MEYISTYLNDMIWIECGTEHFKLILWSWFSNTRSSNEALYDHSWVLLWLLWLLFLLLFTTKIKKSDATIPTNKLFCEYSRHWSTLGAILSLERKYYLWLTGNDWMSIVHCIFLQLSYIRMVSTYICMYMYVYVQVLYEVFFLVFSMKEK